MEKSNIYSTGIVLLTVHSVTYRLSAYLSTVYTHTRRQSVHISADSLYVTLTASLYAIFIYSLFVYCIDSLYLIFIYKLSVMLYIDCIVNLIQSVSDVLNSLYR